MQVTLDPELEAVLDELEASKTRSRSRLVRDLALRGAEALRAERRRREDAIRFLRDEFTSERYDFEAMRRAHESR